MSDQEDKKDEMITKLLRPSEFMKLRHPDLFPDTLQISTPSIDARYLEYELENITSNKKELAFEEFCRRLAGKEICSNLKPVTGPIGGGDGKTDAQTYPVAPALAERCYWGIARPSPPDELWAFAFSAKAKWKAKLYSDVEKISTLKRDFKTVFFITNQFVKGDKRQAVESELSDKYGMSVHVLDRSWIVKTVIEHQRQDIAMEALGIQASWNEKPRPGPLDTARLNQLDQLLNRLNDPDLYAGNDYALAEDYLEASLLARSLAKPRHEIEGFFLRAQEIARMVGDRGQIIRCGYNRAWTSYWWFDDIRTLNNVYSEIEPHLQDTPDAEDCELFCNLWRLLYAAVLRGDITRDDALLDHRRDQIKVQLDRIASDEGRPNNVLHAETVSYLLGLIDAMDNSDRVRQLFEGLERCVNRASGLLTYPLMRFIDNLLEMGAFIGDLPGYTELFDTICRITRERTGEANEGRLLYDRGNQLLNSGHFPHALKYLGMARVKLIKEETFTDMISAALACAITYRAMGLKWAARMEALNAVYCCLNSVESAHHYVWPALLGARLMGWLELELGRISPFISWNRLAWGLLKQAQSLQWPTAKQEEDLRFQEAALAAFFRNLEPSDTAQLHALPERLLSMGMPLAATALLYDLGEKDTASKNLQRLFSLEQSEVEEYFSFIKNQPAADEMPHHFAGDTKPRCIYQTSIMGVHYRMTCDNHFGAIAFSENLMGMLEAALAVAAWENLAFIVDSVDMKVSVRAGGRNPPPLALSEPPSPQGYEFVWKSDMLSWMRTIDRKTFSDYLLQFLLKLLMDITVDPMEDLEQELNRWNDEHVFSLALGTSPTAIAVTHLLGEDGYDFRLWHRTSASSSI
jgi:hypothetical protein